MNFFKIGRVAIACIALGWTGIAQAGLATNVECGSLDYLQIVRGGSACDNSTSYGMYGVSHTVASSEAKYGVLKTSAFSSGNAIALGAGASASAQFSDRLVINSAGMEGKSGTIKFSVLLDFRPEVRSTGYAELHTFLLATARSDRGYWESSRNYAYYEDYQTLYLGQDNGINVDFHKPLTISVPFEFGKAFDIAVHLSTSAYGNGIWSALMDASHSVYWNGVTSLSTEAALTGPVEILSASLTDYSVSFAPASQVPEPSTVWLTGLAALGLAAAQQLRSKARDVEQEPEQDTSGTPA